MTNEKQKAIIVDIDGTIALMNGKRGPFDWDKVGLDDVNEPIVHLLRRFFNGYCCDLHNVPELIFVSGRDDKCKTETISWMVDHKLFDEDNDKLFMRPAGDNRKDYIIKKEIYDNYIREKYDVLFVLDDRDQTVKMWREQGLTCLQVADGNF